MEILRHLQHTLPPFAFEAIKLTMGLILLMVLFPILEKILSLHRQKTFRKGFATDLAYYYISSLFTPRILVIPLSTIAWGVHHLFPTQLYQWTASLPLPIRFGAALIVGEVGFYWGHRCMHKIPYLWRFHAVHHSAEQLDWLVNTRAHPLDMVIIRLFGLIPIYLLGLAQPMVNQVDLVPLVMALVSNLWGYFIHSNVNFRLGLLETLIATPAFHHWHHTNDEPQFVNKNYAALFPWMDKLFGTYYLPKTHRPKRYGINEAMTPNIILQLLYPFFGK